MSCALFIREFAKKTSLMLGLVAVLSCALPSIGTASSARIKDIVEIEGVRDNQLIGYGLVVGLDGTGDSLNSSPFTQQSLVAMLERLGVNVRDQNISTDNVAAVMVTASLPAFGTQGARIDVSVSSLGNAESLLGGTLLVTPLMGADGEVYAVAQGPLTVGGFSAGGEGTEVTKGVPTTARISSGAIIEREIPFQFADQKMLKLALRNPDFTTAKRIAAAVNSFIKAPVAKVNDPNTVQISLAGIQDGRSMVDLITDIEQLYITTDQVARVVVDEASGIIVMGSDVRISTVAIAQGNLTIRITETPLVSQPEALSEVGTTEVVPRTDVQVDEDKDKKLAVFESGVSLQELVQNLNALGIGPRDMIAILQSIKAAGALQAEIEVL